MAPDTPTENIRAFIEAVKETDKSLINFRQI
jgi:hypothetical protein